MNKQRQVKEMEFEMSNTEMRRIIDFLKSKGWTLTEIGELFDYISQ